MRPHDPLREKFQQANVPFRRADRPWTLDRRLLDTDPRDLFLIDIRRHRSRRRRSEEFVQIFSGDHVVLRVIDADSQHLQALLDVTEPATSYQHRDWNRTEHAWQVEEIQIPRQRRRLLVGMDESHLFVCPLTGGASTVRDAHRKLIPVHLREGHGQKLRRQGEWFFDRVTHENVLARIHAEIEADRLWTHRPVTGDPPRGKFSRDHFAEKLVVCDSPDSPGFREVYVRGTIRHPDHKVLHLKTWHAVQRNTEATDGNRVIPHPLLPGWRPRGMKWRD